MKERFVLLLAVVSAVLLVLAGCAPQEAEEEAAEEQETPDRIVIAIGAEPEALDPIAMASAPAATVSEHISQPLVYMSPEGQLQPSLVTEWEAAEDNLSWTLTLREGVTFHDG